MEIKKQRYILAEKEDDFPPFPFNFPQVHIQKINLDEMKNPEEFFKSLFKPDFDVNGFQDMDNNEEIPKPENKPLPKIKDVENEVLKNIVGQDMQIREILTEIYKSIIYENLKSNILIIGKSGTGKTETVTQIAKRLNIPYAIEDATKYTKEGYVGFDVSEMISNLLESADNNLERAEKGLLIIDEIDKKASLKADDPSGKEVLQSLLKIIEGTKVKVRVGQFLSAREVDFDTRNVTVVLMGAFEGIEEIREKRLNVKKMGFQAGTASRKSIPKKERLINKQDLKNYGFPNEFVGRIDNIVEMNELKKGALAKILKNSELSIFRRYEAALLKEGIKLSYSLNIFSKIAEESLLLDTGARELSNTVNYVFSKIMYDVMANPGAYTKCRITARTVDDNTKYKLS